MRLINDVKIYWKCVEILGYAEKYKEKLPNQESYNAYINQVKRYHTLKNNIKDENIRNSLSGLEKEILKITTEKKK